MSYARLSKKPLLFRSFTGLDILEFNIICMEIESKYVLHERKRLSKMKRQRDIGAGRPFKLKVKERFLMLLVCYRLYITFTLSGFLFDLDQSNVYRDISIIEPLVKWCIPLPKKLYNHTKRRRLRTIEEVEEYFPGFKAFVDCTEQEIPRPKNKRKRKSYYSGKKKRHTVKTQYMVNSEGLSVHKTDHEKGRIHDYNVYKNNHPIAPIQVENVFNLAYVSIQNDFPATVKSVLPIRKKKNIVLSNKERIYNRKHSRLRLIIEHAICRIKKCGIMDASGLVNFRIMQTNNRMLL